MTVPTPLAPPAGSGARLHLLLLEDNPADAELCLRELARAGFEVTSELVDTPEEFVARLGRGVFDLVIADYRLPGWTGMDALEQLRQQGLDIPFILVSGSLGDEAAVECLKKGASDYVLKDRLARLPMVAERALRDKAQRDQAARLQEQIARGKREWELTFDTVPDPVFLLGDDCRIQRANRAAADLLGLEPAQLVGQLCYQALHSLDAPRADCPHQRLLETGQAARGTLVEPRLGKVLDCSTTPLRDPDGGLRASIHVLHDITERHLAEEALRLSEEKFYKAFRCSPDAITITTLPEGRYVDVNDGFCRLTGYRRDEAVGRTARDLNVWVDPAERAWVVARLQEGGSVHGLETSFRTRAGERRVGLFSAEKIELSGDPCLLAIVRDITERKRAEEERVRALRLQAENEALARADRLKSEFLADMSHELRSPLNSILGFTELLLENATSLTPPQREDLAIVHRKAQHLLALVNDLLDLSQIEAGQVALEHACLPVKDLLARTLDSFSVRLQEKNLWQRVQADPPDLEVSADPRRLEEILTNLVANAVRFTAQGGLTLRAAARDQQVLFCVEDTGLGIHPADQPRVFDKFYQARQQAEGAGRGTGLGLAITKQLVELHGGRIWLESSPGQGTRFFFTLPRTPQPAPATSSEGGVASEGEHEPSPNRFGG